MKVGIIAAMEEELIELRGSLKNMQEIKLGQFGYYTGSIYDHEVAIMLCGIGKVNAAVGTTLLIDKFKPECVINTGVAGGFYNTMNVGDIVVSTDVKHHDVDATIFNYEHGQIPRMPVSYIANFTLIKLAGEGLPKDFTPKIIKGTILSGDSFIHLEEQVKNIKEKFPFIMAVEMEGSAIGQTCFLFNVPFVVIRSISDIVTAEGSHQDYRKFVHMAAKNSSTLVKSILKNLNTLEK